MKQRVFNLYGKTLNIFLKSWSRAQGPKGLGSGDTTLLMVTHTAGNTSQSTPQNLTVASAVSSSAFGYSQLTDGGDPMQRGGEVPSVLSSRGDRS